jgi:hypothetical protein
VNGVCRGLAASLAMWAAIPVAAQSPRNQDASAWQAPPAQSTSAQVQARQQLAAFEGALENGVRLGAQMLNQRLQASNTDNMVMLAGLTRARGFRLDDYGVVFDVEFPSMRRSMVWSMQELANANAGAGGRAVRTTDAPSAVRPREIYQTEITAALVNAILDYTGSMSVAPTEWLTVAARESVRFVPGDPTDTAITVVLRIKGSDLQAVRERKITRDEGRSRVDVKHY